MKSSAFSIIETLVVVAVIAILGSLTLPNIRFFQKSAELEEAQEGIINTLRLAQNKTLASEGASVHGVYFDTSSSPHRYVLFKGLSFALRDMSFDEVHFVGSFVEISAVALQGGGSEIVFDKILGTTQRPGAVSLRLKTNTDITKTIAIQSSGKITSGVESFSPGLPSLRDSRHAHITYSRSINASSEILTLSFSQGAVTRTIPISENIRSGQFFWEGSVSVAGSDQKLKVQTHRLNSSDTLFSFHRDRRFNNVSLSVSLGDDLSGNIIQYSADGLTTSKSSFYASEPIWQ